MRDAKNILWYLPPAASEAIKRTIENTKESERAFITEIRLRKERPMSLTMSNGKNIVLPFKCSCADISYAISHLTENSLHAHMSTIRNGYINFQNGCRVGICGRAVCDLQSEKGDHAVANISDISSINIRVAHSIPGCSDSIYNVISEKKFNGGTLFYGLPGSGKTTLLRDIAIRAASGKFALRVAIIDSRGELTNDSGMKDCLIDILNMYPKAIGIEIATRTLSPELIICDEIGGYEEARSMLSAQNTGVPMIASAHASCFDELLQRPNIKLLYDHNIFSKYIGIKRDDNMVGGFSFDIKRA